MSSIDGYIVVTKDRRLKSRRGRCAPGFFLSQRRAQNFASQPGDTVMPVSVNMDREPLFIREHLL